MRIVAGEARGRSLQRLDGDDVRPTLDRVREAVFNSLYSYDLIDGCRYLDLFAGSGAMGLEALSRGAGHCLFIDASRAAAAIVDANIAALGYGDRSTVRVADAMRVAGDLAPVDVAVLDPPYDFDAWDDLLAKIDARAIVIESDREIDPGPGWEILRSKRYASTVVVLAERVASPDEPGKGTTA